MRRIASFAAMVCLCGSAWAGIINVTPTNMNGWTLNSFDDNGNIVNSGPYDGTAAMVVGPVPAPYGTGSAHLATPVGAADGAAAIATEQFDTTPLSSITALSYYAYDVTNNGQQFPYLAVSINTGAIDNTPDAGATANTLDTLFFEPPYQQQSTGNPSLPNQPPPNPGGTQQNVWQFWNAYIGGFWDNNGIGNPGTPEGPNPGVEPLSTFLAAYPDATIANGGLPGLGGIALQVGFESSGDTEDGYVDGFTIGIGGVNTTYNFDPAAPVPLPKTAFGGALLMAGLLAWRLRQRHASVI